MATVVIGGVISGMVMSLLVLRVLYMVFAGPLTSTSSTPTSADQEKELATESAGNP